jgi:hypothetical protein
MSDEMKVTRARLRHRKFAEKLVEKGDPVKAYQAVYKNAAPMSAYVQSKFLMQQPDVRQDVKELLNKSGVTLERLNKHLKSILDDSDKEVLTKTGEVVKLVDKPTKLAAVALGYKLHGAGERDSVTVQDNRSITFNASGIPQEQVESKLTDILQRLTDLNKQVQEEKFITGEIETSNAV